MNRQHLLTDAESWAWCLTSDIRAVTALSHLHECNESCWKYSTDGSRTCRFMFYHLFSRREKDENGRTVKVTRRRHGKVLVPTLRMETIFVGNRRGRLLTVRAHPLEVTLSLLVGFCLATSPIPPCVWMQSCVFTCSFLIFK